MLKWLAAAVAAGFVLVVAAALAVPYVVDMPRVQAHLSRSVTQALGRPVRFSSLSVRLFPLPAVTLTGLQIAEDPSFGAAPFLTVSRGSFRVRVWPLLSGRMEFSELVLEGARVALVRDRSGRLNLATLGPASAAPAPGRSGTSRVAGATGALPVVSRVRIRDGAITYTSRAAGVSAAYVLDGLDLTLQGLGPVSPVMFKGEARLRPGDLRIRIIEGSLAVAGSRSPLEAPLRAQVAIEGKHIGALGGLASPSLRRIDGPITGTLDLSGTIGSPMIAGEVALPRLTVTREQPACPPPKRRTLTFDGLRLPITFTRNVLTSEPLTAKLGEGAITTRLSVDLGEGTLQARGLSIRGLPLAPVLVDFVCQGYALTGPLDLDGDGSARTSDLLESLAGAGRLRIGPGKVVGRQALRLVAGVLRVGGAVAALLSADLPSSVLESPLDFESITATYTIDRGAVRTSDLRYTSRPMQVRAAGRYGLADGRVNMTVVMISGRGEIRAKVTGTSSSPVVRVDPTTVAPVRGLERGGKEVEQGVRELLRRLR